MRIITGKYKGRRLTSVPDSGVRPATDRAKGTIFNALQNRLSLVNARVLDLFAGSGSLGLEALSRGAAAVTFVDERRDALDVISANARNLNCLDSCTMVRSDALSFIEREGGRFDLVFADPPYAYEETSRLPAIVFGNKLIEESGFLIIEYARGASFEPSPLFRLVLRKELGRTQLGFFVPASARRDGAGMIIP
jgi:16S rRNA (guanine(966)-N(2))-methyltransferase RsmD